MLAFFAFAALILIVLSWGRHAWWSLRLASHFPPRTLALDPPDRAWPRVTILLPVRGSDPVLRESLRALCQLDYPCYDIRIIVDHPEDPAWALIHEVLAELPDAPVKTFVLTQRLQTCSLKVSALLQGLEDLDEATGVVVFMDADVLPPVYWLRELVRPFEDPRVGATSGLRWYHTHSTTWGALVRGLWGAGAAAQMFHLEILWGGSLAFRASIVRDPALRELWSRCFVEDTSAVRFLRERGYQMRLVPRLTLINPESISLAGCYRFIRRQVLCVRLYHPAWSEVIGLTLGMALSVPLTLLVAALAWQQGEGWLGWSLLGALLAGILGTGLPLVWIDGYFYYSSPEDNRLAPLRWKHLPVIPLTVILHLLAVLSACRLREMDWRGIRYAIEGPYAIRRLNDTPYVESQGTAEHPESIV